MLKHFSVLSTALSMLVLPAAAQNAASIEQVRSGQSCPGCNLFQADLTYQSGEKLNLSGARMMQSDLSLATYDQVNFSGANLSIANLFGARFNRTNFANSNLSDATAVGTFFGSSDLSGANLQGANLSGADLEIARGLTQAQLDRACGDTSTRLPAGKTIPSCS